MEKLYHLLEVWHAKHTETATARKTLEESTLDTGDHKELWNAYADAVAEETVAYMELDQEMGNTIGEVLETFVNYKMAEDIGAAIGMWK